MKLTVICPVYNESKFIVNVLEFCINAHPLDKQIFFIDGNSTDNTCELINAYAAKHNNIKLLHNPEKYVPFALNKAIVHATGDIVVRLDAHTLYADDYFEKVIEAFNNTQADIVGGPMRIANGSILQDAVGYATSTSFGIGNSSFHFEDFEGFTDSVYLGAWKRKIFEQTGLFDESLVRNQDDEFHYRAKSKGFRIYQSPEIKLYYFPRNSFKTLFKQYYQYGLYKPLVLRKIKSALSIRHIVPMGFVLYLVSLIFFAAIGWYFMFLPLALYVTANLFFSASSKKSIGKIWRIAVSYTILHLAYGSGFIVGLLRLPFVPKNEIPK
jgi:succinoglycan biosynthesis protein ExoA